LLNSTENKRKQGSADLKKGHTPAREDTMYPVEFCETAALSFISYRSLIEPYGIYAVFFYADSL
jgi:hypothetical protein